MPRYLIRSTDTTLRYQNDCPLLLAASSILLDQQDDIAIGQLKFQNIAPSGKQIRAATISISCFETYHAPCGEVEKFSYLDLSVDSNAFFGQQTPIALPSLDTHSIEVTVMRVLFSDNTIWDRSNGASMQPVSDQPKIASLGELAAQYCRELELTDEQGKLFIEVPDYWLCCCGAYNDTTAEKCRLCNRTREKQRKAVDTDYLKVQKEEFDRRKIERQKEEQVRLTQEKIAQEQAALEEKKSSSKMLIICLAAAVCVVSGLVYFISTGPQRNYNNGISLYESGNYVAAYNAFETAGEDFKDSQEKLKQCRYGQAVNLCEQKKYQEAIQIFSDVGEDYLDTKEYLEKCYYGEAVDNYTQGKYVLAHEQFSFTDEQTDKTKEYMQQCIEKGYEKATSEYSDNGIFPDALRSPMFDGYLDTDKYRIILDSTLVVLHVSTEEQIKDSYKAMRGLGDFGNAPGLLKDEKYIFWLLNDHSFTNQSGCLFELNDSKSHYSLQDSSMYDDVDSFELKDNVYTITRKDGSTHDCFRFDFYDENTLKLYCFRDNSTYTLYRQY